MKQLILLILILSECVCATEADYHSYRDIELKDAKDVVNLYFNEKIFSTIDYINHEVVQGYISHKQAEIYFHGHFFQSRTLESQLFSSLEKCLDAGECMGQPVERILLFPGESIYAKSEYSFISSRYLASRINLCGHHVSTDKLTHMLVDGYVLYQYYMAGHKYEELRAMSENWEHGLMGLAFTGIYSNADIEANEQGFKFFYQTFQGKDPYLKVIDDKKIVQRKPFDICNYITDRMDEKLNPNSYIKIPSELPAGRSAAAKRVRSNQIRIIERRLSQLEQAKIQADKESQAREARLSPKERALLKQELISREMPLNQHSISQTERNVGVLKGFLAFITFDSKTMSGMKTSRGPSEMEFESRRDLNLEYQDQ